MKTLKNLLYSNKKIIIALLLSSSLFGGIGYFLGKSYSSGLYRSDTLIERRKIDRSSKFVFTNQLLECNVNFNFFNTDSIEEKIQNIISRARGKNQLTDIGVYIRMLNNGSILGIDEDSTFVSASLTKLPLAIAYGKFFEDGLLSFEDTITVPLNYRGTTKRNLGEDRIVPGKAYKIKELIKEMLANSDNTAAGVLIEHIGLEKLNTVYLELGLRSIDIREDGLVRVSAKDISRFLRVLYNASYISRSNSELLLGYLSDSEFKIGIKKGISNQIPLVNKFGEVGFLDRPEKQLHDCGIVYYPENPYLICVMTKGQDLAQLSDIISSISQVTFEEISKP